MKIFNILRTIKTKNGNTSEIKLLENEFLNWLQFANAGMMNPGNIACFEYAIKNIKSNNPILEIGSFCGLTANVLNYFLFKYNKKNKVICVDKWVFEGSEKKYLGDSDIRSIDYKEFVKNSFKRSIELFSKKNLPYVAEMFSDEFFELYASKNEYTDMFGNKIPLGNLFSFCFIEHHTYEATKNDFYNCDKYLEEGGFILFDDTFDGTPFGCGDIIPLVQNSGKYELVFKNPNYLFKKIKS